jgi:hypothetical protein
MTAKTLSELVESIVRATLPELDFYAHYSAEVLSQNADGTLELRPDDARHSALSSVPIYHGLPGQEVKVTAGARVFFQFVGADRRRPIVTHWEKQNLSEHQVDAAVKFVLNSTTIEINGTTIYVNGTAVRLGGPAGVDQLIKGTTYRAAETAAHTTITAAATAAAAAATTAAGAFTAAGANPVANAADVALAAVGTTLATTMATFLAALAAALTAMEGGSLTYLSLVSKTE